MPAILTENEAYGNGFLDETAPGAWVVMDAWQFGEPHLRCIFSNRTAAEAFIAGQPKPETHTLSVWKIMDVYDWEEE